MSEPPKARAHVWVTGRVQGVGFRAFVADNAEALGVTGWVRNVGWDTVEAVAEGGPEAVEKFTQIVIEGPSVARVREHRVESESPTGEFLNFEVRYSK
jgi:acylphosphatase